MIQLVCQEKKWEIVEIDGRDVPYFTANMILTALFNMTCNPAVVLPAGRSKRNLPIGIQVVARRWNDMALLSATDALTEITGPFQAPPDFQIRFLWTKAPKA
jgi:amidase